MRHLRIVIYVFVLCAASAASAADFGETICQVSGKVVEVVPVDVDNDGLLDLVVSYRQGLEPSVRARLAVVFNYQDGYATKPGFDIPVPADACVFDVADVDGDDVAELVLFRKWSVEAIKFENAETYRKIALIKRGSGVMFPPDDGELPYAKLVRDWRGDGATVLALPDYGSLRFFQLDEEGQFAVAEKIKLPARGWITSNGMRPPGANNYSIRSGVTVPNVFLTRADSAPRSLIVAFREELWFHRVQERRFSNQGKRIYLPILTEEERRNDNMELLSLVDDIDGDGHVDAVLNKFGGSITNYRSTIQIYRGMEGGFSTEPGFSLEMSGFTAYLRFWDIDGDGKKELGMPTIDIGLMQIARMLISKSMKVGFKLFRCHGPVGPQMYRDKPEIERRLTLKMQTEPNTAIVGFAPSFDGDFDGDGRLDLFVAYEDGFGVWKNKGGLKLSAQPMLTHRIAPTITYRLQDLDNDQRCDFYSWDSLNPEEWGKIKVLINRR